METEREEIQAAAQRTGDPWLRTVAVYGGPASTPLLWANALTVARKKVPA